ncbi:hypothetical protein U1Q18_024764 [Sarracenia purpurea var. burkii]
MDLETQKGEEDSADSVESDGGVQYNTAAVIEIGEDGNRSAGNDVAENPGEEREAKTLPGEAEKKDAKAEAEKEECVIEVKGGGGSSGAWGGLRAEKVCRICHLGSENSSENSELIRLGCGCKEELGISHLRCAETWFMHKGSRQCEICGETARNVTGIEDSRIVMLEWNEIRLIRSATDSSGREGSRQCRHSVYYILLACFILFLIIPWFFQVAMD